MIKRTREEVEEVANELGYELLGEYVSENKKDRKIIIQDNTGYKYDVRLSHLMDGHSPWFVSKSNSFSLENISLWLKLNRSEFELCDDNLYTGKSDKLKFYHSICKDYFYSSWSDICRYGCGICAGQQIGQFNNLAFLRPDLAAEWDYERNKLRPEQVTQSSGKKVWWICNTCKYNWFTKINNRTSSGNGCINCSSSKGEKQIKKWLDENNVCYNSQIKFEKCVSERQLTFDFYLSAYNLCVEYNGIQHYKPVAFFGGAEQLRIQRKNDRIKKNYCKHKNINLLIIPYWEFDSIEFTLKQTLKELS